MDTPSVNGPLGGRDERGRFMRGNRGGPGNPHVEKTAKLRSALLSAVTEKDLKAVVMKLVKLAKDGDVVAAREILNRCIGKPVETIVADVVSHTMPPLSPEDVAIAERIATSRLGAAP